MLSQCSIQVSSKDEDFLDLSVDVEQNTSITHCLRGFSSTETLCSEYKYYCEVCCSKQEAQKRWVSSFSEDVGTMMILFQFTCSLHRMRVKKLPHILALHLKRFKYMEQLNRYTKLSYRVVFPLELRLFNTVNDNESAACIAISPWASIRNVVLFAQSDDASNPDRMYDLIAVVIHCGTGPNRGHYISIVKSHGLWLLFDDDIVDVSSP